MVHFFGRVVQALTLSASVFLLSGVEVEESCGADDPTCAANTNGDVLLQRIKKHGTVKVQASEDVHQYGPLETTRSAMEFYKFWVDGAVKQRLKAKGRDLTKTASALVDQKMSAGSVLKLLDTAFEAGCPGELRESFSAAALHSEHFDNGVFHGVFVLPSGKLQYVAAEGGKLLLAEPAIHCPSSLMQQEPAAGEKPQPAVPMAGNSHLIDVLTPDPVITACAELFQSVMREHCGKDGYKIEFLQAQEIVIDGISIKAGVKLTSNEGKVTYHKADCHWHVSEDHTDASLVQIEKQEPVGKPDAHLIGRIHMKVDMCEVDEANSVEPEEARNLGLLQQYSFGELSRYKGYEWMIYELPHVRVETRTAPSSYDIRTIYPMCFVGTNYDEAVRNQGNCGSCWAFASATTAMTQLCTSKNGQGATASSTDRFEISTQQIMSCNANQQGCNGGNANAAASAWSEGGIHKERDFLYKCGGGDPLDHFDSGSSCDAAPWGANCPAASAAVSNWNFGGISVISGEGPMKEIIATGNALYGSFDVYGNFMSKSNWGGDIYTNPTGGINGGHAVTLVAYGSQGGTDYWVMQNSWGPTWADDGYAKFKRGTNLAGIEDNAYYVRAWVSGGTAQPCFESTTGYSSGSGPISCDSDQGKSMCADYADVRANCPVTCDSCEGWVDGPTPPPTPPPPTPPPPPPTPPPPTPPPTPEPTYEPGSRKFESSSGGCVITDNGGCVTSSNYPSGYPDNDACTIQHSGAFDLEVDNFKTEAFFDKLTVKGKPYSGSDGPSNKNVGKAPIVWSADFSTGQQGWKICVKGAPAPAPATPTPGSGEAGQCMPWCSTSPKAWNFLCTKDTCSGCSPCQAECMNWCSKSSLSWDVLCKRDACSGCSAC